MKVAAALLLLVALAARADGGSRIRCPRAQYPYMQLQVYACSRLQSRPPVIRLDPANYARLRAEMERCVGHPILGRITLCGIPVVPAARTKGQDLIAGTLSSRILSGEEVPTKSQ
jgi:hypothetical protein